MTKERIERIKEIVIDKVTDILSINRGIDLGDFFDADIPEDIARAIDELISEDYIPKHKLKPIAQKVYNSTMDEMTKTLGSISLTKYQEPYKPKTFEEIYKSVAEEVGK